MVGGAFFILIALMAIGAMTERSGSQPNPTSPNYSTPTPAPSVSEQNPPVSIEHAEEQMSKVMQDPEKLRYMECMGINPWKQKPAGWTAPTAEECSSIEQDLDAKSQAQHP